MERKKLISIIQYSLIALCGLTLVCMPIVATYGPSWARKYRTSKASSSDPKTRELGLNYIIKNAPRDTGTRQAAVDLMASTQDDANFLQIMRALDYAGVWNRQTVPALTYLRWLGILAKDPNPKNRMVASQFLGELADIADNPAVVTLVSLMIADTDAEARYAALVACADLAHAGNNPAPFVALIKQCTADPNNIVAQQAWLMLGSLKAADTLPTNLAQLPDGVAQAAAWALIQSNAKGAQEAILTLVLNPQTPMATRTGCVYALRNSNSPEVVTGLANLLSRLKPPPDNIKAPGKDKPHNDSGESFTLAPANAWLLWRAVLAFPPMAGSQDDPNTRLLAFTQILNMKQAPSVRDNPQWNMLFCAAQYKWAQIDGMLSTPDRATLGATDIPNMVKNNTMFALAALEGLPPRRPCHPSRA